MDPRIFQTRFGGPRGRAGEAPVALVLVLALVAVGAAVWIFYLRTPPEPPKAPVLTDEAREYIREGNLKLGSVEMSAKESFAGHQLIEITGIITNAGGRTLKLVEVNCVFFDPYGMVVLRERVPIVRARTGGLKPGETWNFRLPFENIPESWNQDLPQLVIAQILFD